MIEYQKHSFGLNGFWTVFTGSAWPKAMPAAILSALFHLFLEWMLEDGAKEQMSIDHPYALGVVFSAVGFLIVFRANHAYARLANAADYLYHMETRAFDGVIQFKAFHMQTEDFKLGSDASKKWLDQFYHLWSLVIALSCLALRRDEDLANLVGYSHDKVPSSTIAMNSLNVIEGEERFYRPQSLLRRLHYAASMRSSIDLRKIYHRHSKLEVYGGISVEECVALQPFPPKVRTELASMWLTAFLTTAEKEGELGNTPPPIVSRAFSWLSDSMLGFAKALRVVEVPFPFIIAQIAELSVISLVPLVPILHHSVITESVWMGAGFSFLTCLIFIGLYESARDVEDPFAYEPNDLPLVALCRRFNESLRAVDIHPSCPSGQRLNSPLAQVQDHEQDPGIIVAGVRAANRVIRTASSELLPARISVDAVCRRLSLSGPLVTLRRENSCPANRAHAVPLNDIAECWHDGGGGGDNEAGAREVLGIPRSVPNRLSPIPAETMC